MTEPRQKPHRSKQDYETPPELLAAVARRFGPLAIDLAARLENRKAPAHLGPGTTHEDAVAVDWRLHFSGVAWLNPPFADIEPWAAKCAATLAGPDPDRRIVMLTPASIGSNWFAAHVNGRALVLGLSPRLTFVGAKDPYPKDCMLSVFGETPGFDVWRWKP